MDQILCLFPLKTGLKKLKFVFVVQIIYTAISWGVTIKNLSDQTFHFVQLGFMMMGCMSLIGICVIDC